MQKLMRHVVASKATEPFKETSPSQILACPQSRGYPLYEIQLKVKGQNYLSSVSAASCRKNLQLSDVM